jgi:sporulation integral membrane protein YtvI
MNTNHRDGFRNTIKGLITAMLILAIIYIGVTYFFLFFAPFVLAILISLINEPFIKFIEKHLRLGRKTASVISIALTVSIIATVITIVIMKIYYELIKLQGNLPVYIESVSNIMTGYYNRASIFYYSLPDSISSALETNLRGMLPDIERVITSTASSILGSLTSIPRIALFIMVTLLSSFFISSDKDTIINFLYRQFPHRFKKNIYGIKSDTLSAVLGYFRAQLIIISITFVESTLGFIIIKADYAVLMGFITALSDAVPVLGTNIVMLPWILWNVITGNIKMALGLTGVYILGIILRQVFEPKIVAHQTGLHPFAALVSMYIGFLVFGFTGLFIGPVLAIFLKSLQSSGIVSIWND